MLNGGSVNRYVFIFIFLGFVKKKSVICMEVKDFVGWNELDKVVNIGKCILVNFFYMLLE